MGLVFSKDLDVYGKYGILPEETSKDLDVHGKHGILHDEIIADILSRLNAKIICRFKCVSKQWFSMIKDPYFVNMHRVRSMRNSPFLVQTRHDYYKGRTSLHICNTDKNGRHLGDFEIIVDDFGVDKMVSSGNLICLESRCKIYVCNPSMHQLLRLPAHGGSHCTKLRSIGIGHLPAANAYKVVVFYYECDINHYMKLKCEVLTITDGYKRDLGSSSWRNIEVCTDQIWIHGTSVCVNEALYWKLTDPESAILKFELENEKFDLLHYPPMNNSFPITLNRVAEIKGKICLINGLIIYSKEGRVQAMDVWMLNDPSRNVWGRKYRIDFSRFAEPLWRYKTFWEQDGEVWLHSNTQPLLYYNLENETFRAAGNLGPYQKIDHSCVCFDGLFSLGAGKSEDLIRF